ncbi:multidrug effflux MFS transporter [Shimia biformata]|uniref:multidrug effflux MFS transporter n=1 Tax=Shimia biformata TaxID=1294299 RepID=UPI001950A7AE|nr:multidrug effflux MFS transporter [Shimia biformata]
MRAATSPPRLFTLVFLTALSVLSLNMFLPSLPGMAVDFGVSYGAAGWMISGYLILTAVLQILFGPLSDLFGRRPVLLVGMAIFVVASLGCMMTDSFLAFAAFRMLQASSVSAMAISRAIVRDTHEPDEAAAKLGVIGMAMAIAPMLGPMVGGVLDQVSGWRSVFLAYAFLGLFGAGLVWVDLGETNTSKGGGFRAQAQSYPELFRSRRFWGYTMCLAFSIGAFYAYIAGMPLLGARLGLPPSQTGLALGAPTAGFFVGNFLTGRLVRRSSLLKMILIGRTLTLGGTALALILIAIGAPPIPSMIVGAVSVGLGNGLTAPNANAGVMSVRPQLAGSASGLSGAVGVLAGAVLTNLATLTLTANPSETALLVNLLGCAVLALSAALYVRYVDRKEAVVTAS